MSMPSRKIVKKMGFLADQQGIMSRYIREEGGWESHLAKTRQYITSVIDKNKPESVAILGSGWLLDVPVEYLSATCKQVVLYDIHHPVQVCHKLREFKNIVFIEDDLSGGYINEIYNVIKMYRKNNQKVPVENIKSHRFVPDKETDYTISVNLLNQLDILLIDYLKNFSIYSEAELKEIRTNIQHSHIDSLKQGHSSLITDYQEILSGSRDEQPEGRSLIYTKLPEGKSRKYWNWSFDTGMTYYSGKKTMFKVVGIEL